MIDLKLQLFGGRGMKSLLIDKKYLGDSKKIKVVSSRYYIKLDANSCSSLNNWEKEISTIKEEVIVGCDASGKPISAYAGNGEIVEFPIFEAKKWSGGIVTHNHPKDFGGTFSQQDILTYTQYKYKEMRVVANEGTYRLIATERADYERLAARMLEMESNLQNQMDKIFFAEYDKYSKRCEPKMSEREFEAYRRNKMCRVLHAFYKKHCINYGFAYRFEKSKKHKS